MKKKSLKEKCLLSGIAIGFLVMLGLELFRGRLTETFIWGSWFYDVLVRGTGGIVCLLLMAYCSLSGFLTYQKGWFRSLFPVLPCFLIAINNFPFLSCILGDARIGAGARPILLYAAVCLSVGFFEEAAFRGCVFTLFFIRRKRNVLNLFLSILLSSAVFGIVHLVNLFAGASVGSVLLQVSYSFLIGGLCSIILVKTRNLWHCILFHACYNFAGGLIPECGSGTIWTAPTVILTVVVSVIVAVYVIWMLFHIRKEEIDAFFLTAQIKEKENENPNDKNKTEEGKTTC